MGSPAHAGIDPHSCFRSRFPARFPRTRGDRPAGDSNKKIAGMVPPHTRG